jgi:hypothetical protein
MRRELVVYSHFTVQLVLNARMGSGNAQAKSIAKVVRLAT